MSNNSEQANNTEVVKKNVISDFSALKGKVTFSELSSVVPGDKEVAKSIEPDSGNVLKVGQKVVLMDSDLRGKIVSLGRTVGIELEDGLVIKAAYGEFAVTHTDEITALKQSRVKPKKTVTSPRPTLSKPNSNAIEVDLHIQALPGGRNIPKGQHLDFQMETFRKVIRENAPHRGRTITFIHGVGDGILKAAIRKELDEVLALRCSYSVGDPAVTVVTIK